MSRISPFVAGLLVGFTITMMVFSYLISEKYINIDELKSKHKVLIEKKLYVMCEYTGRRDFRCQ